MSYEMIIFDLDGTLTNPELGFLNCINHALNAHNLPLKTAADMAKYIGPPLDQTALKLANGDEALTEKLMNSYRDQYSLTGYQENVVYDGIEDVLQNLYDNPNIRIGVCTSKREDFAVRILKMHGLFDFFEFVSGANDGTSKTMQLAALLETGKAPKNSIMVGDRLFDMRAATNNGLDKAGVLWGFGERVELEEYKPQFIFEKTSQLLQLADAE